MRRKTQPKAEPIVPPEILEQAKRSISPDQLKKTAKCSVCGGETAASANDQLCWVCRRLKISAWREIEQQMPVQE
jgi:hypothetical protein